MKLHEILLVAPIIIHRKDSCWYYLKGRLGEYDERYQWSTERRPAAYYDDGMFDVEDVLADNWEEAPFEEWPYTEQLKYKPKEWRALYYPNLTDTEFVIAFSKTMGIGSQSSERDKQYINDILDQTIGRQNEID